MTREIKVCQDCGSLQGKERSLPDHNRLFAIWHKAFLQWNDGHPYQPTNETELRGWCLIKVGHHDVVPVQYTTECHDNPAAKKAFRVAAEITAAAVGRGGGYIEIRVSAAGIEILKPKSIAFGAIDQKAFGKIREACEAIIEEAIGVPCDQLLRERAA